MINLPDHASVVIVGAGPSGLMMAALLLRQGIQPVIIDSKKELTKQSRALAVHARSLEILRQLGLSDQFLKEGTQVSGFDFYFLNDEQPARLGIDGADKTLFPFVLTLEQSKTEKNLLEDLTAHACPVYWDSSLVHVEQSDEGVMLQVSQGELDKSIRCDWLIGADGASSAVRKAFRINFSGGSYIQRFYLADLNLTMPYPDTQIRIISKKEGFNALFPISDNLVRCIGIVPATLKDRTDLSFDDLKPYITFTLGVPLQVESCNWFSVYGLHHRMADRFRSRRVFLIGDAAHVHSPVGGQGMNTGLQDAYNLAWKLAGVVNNEYDKGILDSYSSERMPVARGLLKTTDRLFSMIVSDNFLIKRIRKWMVPVLLQRIAGSKDFKGELFKRISQIGISYRKSTLSVHHSASTTIKAGDRLPFMHVYDEKLKVDSDLHQWCSKGGFTLLVLGELNPMTVSGIAKWIKSAYPFALNFFYMPPSDRNKAIFEAFEINSGKAKRAIVVRPDLHIGYINDIVDTELIDGYLKQVIGWRKT